MFFFLLPQDKTGTFSLSGTTAVGTFAETVTGVSSTDTWIAQTAWNGDKLDGTGASGITADWSKGQVFQIDIQYLGFGGIVFKVEVVGSGNNPDFVVVHTIAVPNSRTTPTVTQPSFPFTMSAYSAGSTTDVSVEISSFAGFVEGKPMLNGPKMTHTKATSGFVGSAASTYYPLFTLCNSISFKGRANQSTVNVTGMAGGHDDATPVTYYMLRNATLLGTPNFTEHSTNSCVYKDTAATTCTISNQDQIIESIPVGQNAGFIDRYEFGDITIQPGETLTLACTASTGTATYVDGTLNTREDH